MMARETQKILVVKTSDFFPDKIWEGFKTFDEPEEILELINRKGEYKPRGQMETDPNYQQIIPQVILRTESKLFIHKIPVSGNESRLHDLWPIFLGGHVEPGDGGIEEAADREFNEEIDYQGNILQKEFRGVINLQDNPVNSVHVGLVWVYLGNSEKFRDRGDEGVSDGKFVTWDEAEKLSSQMSYWSKVAFPVLKLRYAKSLFP